MKHVIFGAVLWFLGIAAVLLSVTPWFGMWTTLIGVALVVLGTFWVLGNVTKVIGEFFDEFFKGLRS